MARRNAQVGQAVSVGGALMAVVTTDQMWLDANFKETQLTHMRIGQPVKIHFDLYGKIKPLMVKWSELKWVQAVHSHYCLLKMRPVTGSKWCNVCLCVFN